MSHMSLTGRLADFSLEEILQLMALQQKTGLLTVEASLPMALSFDSGYLVGYRDRRNDGEDPLESFLRRYGFFTAEQWEHVDFIGDNSRLDLTEILVNEGLFTEEELEAAQFEAAQEHIFCGMMLRDGRYQFTSGRDGLVGLKGRVRFKVDGLLMEAVRRIDEWPQLQERFGDPQLKVRRVNAAADLSHRSDTEKRLLGIVGESCTVGHLVARAKLSEFDSLNVLEQLRAEEILQVQQAVKADGPRRKRRKGRTEHRPSPVRSVSLAFASVLLVMAGLVLQPWAPYRDAEGTAHARVEAFEDAQATARTRSELELYARARGRYPGELSRLAGEGRLRGETLGRVQARFEYRATGDGEGYTLLPR